jgi:uncharacterized protein DUF4129
VQTPPPDSLRRAVAEVFARPEYRWTTGRRPGEWLLEQVGRFLDWLARMRQGHPVGYEVFEVVAIVALVGLVAHWTYIVWRITRPTTRTPAGRATGPGLLLEDARAHRERADDLARAGRYVEALAHRFVAVVLDLDRREAVKFHPSKTPAEYVGEARLDSLGRATFADLVTRLYRHVFGAIPCDERAYRAFADEADLVFEHVAAA